MVSRGVRWLVFVVELAIATGCFFGSDAREPVDVRSYHLAPAMLGLVGVVALEAAVLATIVPLVELGRPWAKVLVGLTFLWVFGGAVGALSLINRLETAPESIVTGVFDGTGTSRDLRRFGIVTLAGGQRLSVPMVVLERHHLVLGSSVSLRLRPGLVFDVGWVVDDPETNARGR